MNEQKIEGSDNIALQEVINSTITIIIEKSPSLRPLQDNPEEWFKSHLDKSIANLGVRYSPQINIELDIAPIFDALARGEAFKVKFENTLDVFLQAYNKIKISDQKCKQLLEELNNLVEQVKQLYSQIQFDKMEKIESSPFIALLENLIEQVRNIEEAIQQSQQEKIGEPKEQKSRNSDSRIRDLNEFINTAYQFKDFLNDRFFLVSNHPYLLLRGKAGAGKSHLLADIAEKRIKDGNFSLLLLGQHFTTEVDPWTQILRNLLRLDCSEDDLLSLLNNQAQLSGSRIIVFIDAINEGKGKHFWKNHISGFVKSFEKYEWLGLVMSIRTSYEQSILNNIPKDLFISVNHLGFSGIEYEASKRFFTHYQIEQPKIPLLHPEFQNPLFLKLFCEGLYRAGLHTIPEGFTGITKIINFYLKNVNQKLSGSNFFNYNSDRLDLVKEVVQALLEEMLSTSKPFVPYKRAYEISEGIVQAYVNERGFLNHLVKEGVLSENRFHLENNKYQDVVYFAYERFGDHLKTSYLLEGLEAGKLSQSFQEGGILFPYFKDKNRLISNQGIIEALSIQLPEKFNQDLYELVPSFKDAQAIKIAFIKSLMWRDTNTVNKKLLDYINNFLLKDFDSCYLFFQTMISVASNPKHLFNADLLHDYLTRYSLAERDANWTQITYYLYDDEPTSVKRLIDWAWSEEDKSHISDESRRLTAIALAWFLTSPNRSLRDAATKALVSLLEKHLNVLLKILKAFEGVNDPYVYERLFAVAYGCVMRNGKSQPVALKSLAEYIYNTIFNQEEVYPHILLRDYARNTIEYALHIGLKLSIEKEKIQPPYNSKLPSKLPDTEVIEKLIEEARASKFKHHLSLITIIDSMQPEHSKISGMYGDFGRYIFQSPLKYWNLDTQKLSNWCINRILELGYDVEKHGKFDRRLDEYGYRGRTASKPERIGKKYQWLAFYEILARVADNFEMNKNPWGKTDPENYAGTWKPYVRDIDPSLTIYQTKKTDWESKPINWWCTINFNGWNIPPNKWINQVDDLPKPHRLIQVSDEKGEDWLSLYTCPGWREPLKPGQNKYDSRKKFWYLIKGYLVKESDYKKVLEYLTTERAMERRMPEIDSSYYELFSREYYWSPAFKYFRQSSDRQSEWETPEPLTSLDSDKSTNEHLNFEFVVPVQRFLWEAKYDMSKEDHISFYMSSQLLFQGMNMRYGKLEGEFTNQEGKVICFDPSVKKLSSSGLLVRKPDFMNFLAKEKLKIFWTLIGEKNVRKAVDQNDFLEFSGCYYLDQGKITGGIHYAQEDQN